LPSEIKSLYLYFNSKKRWTVFYLRYKV
jgi:hypothetical protein